MTAANRVAKLDIGSEAYSEPIRAVNQSFCLRHGTSSACKATCFVVVQLFDGLWKDRLVFVRQPRWARLLRFWPSLMTSNAWIG